MKAGTSPKSKAHWPTVAIVGTGLIGGSVGLAVQARRLATRVIGVGRSAPSLAAARKAKVVTETSLDLEAAVADADLVVIATDVGTIPTILERVDAAVKPGTLVTDAGSTKASIVSAWEKRRRSRRSRFVGGHPIAGSHRSGPAAATASLFEGRITVVTPASATPADDAEAIGGFWSALGSTVFMMPPQEHDKLLAATSHAPHLMAAAIAVATPATARQFTAGGWKDTTRIAAGDPDLWADILLDNAANVATALAKIARAAEKMITAIEVGDRRRLVTLLSQAKEERDAVGG